jgi:hypothetical protein
MRRAQRARGGDATRARPCHEARPASFSRATARSGSRSARPSSARRSRKSLSTLWWNKFDRAVEFIRSTGVTCFSPDLGTAHGDYQAQPEVDFDRARAITAATGTPLVLHGGTGLDRATIAELVDCGVRKVNVSTQVKRAYLDAVVRVGGAGGEPLELLREVRGAVRDVASSYFRTLDQHLDQVTGRAADAAALA